MMQMSDYKTWVDLIRAQSVNGRHDEVLSLFLSMVRAPFGYKPDHIVLQSALKSCACIPAVNIGRILHSVVVKLGHLCCLSVSKGLLNVYAKGKAFDDCKKLFDQMPKCDTVVWNIVLAGLSGSHVHDNEVMRLVYDMHTKNEAKMNPVTAAVVLPVCARLSCLNAGRSVHSYGIKSGWVSETLAGNALMSMYAKCGRIHDGAYPSFCEIDEKDVVSWNGIIAGFIENGFHNDAYRLFRHMLMGPVAPNFSTLASILPLCFTLDRDNGCSLGRELHAYTLKQKELHSNLFVLNGLMSYYLRIGLFEYAETLFNRMTSRDLVSWNAIISGFISNNRYSEAIHLFHKLVSEQVLEPSPVTLISVIPACVYLRSLRMVKQIHGYIVQRPDLLNDIAVSNSLISSYAKCDDLGSSFRTFMVMSQRDLISWNSMLDAFAGNGCELQMINNLHQMLEEGLGPDSITMLTLIRFYGNSSNLLKVKEAHGYALRACLCQNNTQCSLSSALLDAYGKCGTLDYAHNIFGMLLGEGTSMLDSTKSGSTTDRSNVGSRTFRISHSDPVTLNILMRAYVENNCHEKAASLLFDLQDQGVKPDAAIIMSILPMCTKMASVNLVRQCHGYIIRACIEAAHLRGTLIDAYSKCGSVNLAAKLFWSSHQKDLVMFTALIGGYAVHGMAKEAAILFNHMVELGIRLDHVVFTAILSACCYAGLVDEGLRIFHSIEKVHGMKPNMEQYGCVVDLLARQGKVRDAYAFVTKMPVKPNASIWSILLGACRNYDEAELSQIVAAHLSSATDKDIGSYVTMSNVQAADANWDEVLEIRKLMKGIDLQKPAGCSWM